MAEYKGILNPVPKNRGGYDNYSTTEHEIGTWIDGSTLYEKTVNIGTMPNATYKNTNHGVSNMGSVVSVIGTMIRTSDNVCKPLPFGLTSSNNFVSVEVTPSVVYVSTGTDYSAYNGYITIRYTKTS